MVKLLEIILFLVVVWGLIEYSRIKTTVDRKNKKLIAKSKDVMTEEEASYYYTRQKVRAIVCFSIGSYLLIVL